MKVKIPQMLIWELVKKIFNKKVKTKKAMMKNWIKKIEEEIKKEEVREFVDKLEGY